MNQAALTDCCDGCVDGCHEVDFCKLHECVWPCGTPPSTWSGATFDYNCEVSDFATKPYDLLVVHSGCDKFPATANCDFGTGLCERDCVIQNTSCDFVDPNLALLDLCGDRPTIIPEHFKDCGLTHDLCPQCSIEAFPSESCVC